MSDTDRAGDVDEGRVKIRLDKLTKHFPGQREPAVGELSMEIPEGRSSSSSALRGAGRPPR